MSKIISNEVPEEFFVALCVWAGQYGNGQERITKLTSEGYNAEHIQQIVNLIGAVFEECDY